MDKVHYYLNEALKLDSDSVNYLYGLYAIESVLGNYIEAVSLGQRITSLDTTNTRILKDLGKSHMFLGQYEESLKYYEKYVGSCGCWISYISE